MEGAGSKDNQAVLHTWQTKTLNILLVVLSVVAIPAWIVSLISSNISSRARLLPVIMTFALAIVIALAALRRLDYRVRAWGLLLVGYLMVTVLLFYGGIHSPGAWYALVLPVLALILVGVRGGILAAALSAFELLVVSVLYQRGFLTAAAFQNNNFLGSVTTFAMLLTAMMVLLVLFYRFQLKTIEAQRRTAGELKEAHVLMEEQNRTLEERIAGRTAELLIINSVQAALASRLDMQAIYDLVGDKMREIFTDADATIRIYDPKTNLVHWPYVYTKGKRLTVEANPLTEEGFIAHVLRTRKTVVVNENMEQAVEKYHSVLFPGLQREKSCVHVPLVIGDEVIGVITLVDMQHEGVFTESGVRMLETLAGSMSVALENARLFDETEQRAAQLQESQRRLADIINFLPDAVMVTGQDGKVTAWNHAIEELTGIKAEQMLGKGDCEYALPFYGERRPILIDLVSMPQEQLMEKYSQVRMEGAVLVGETFVPQLRGREAYLLGTASVLRDSGGNRVGAIEVIRDFTERKRLEEDLNRAKEAAEAATQAKSAFLATMSHEIRTPMNAVIGMTGLLLDTPLTSEQHDFAETIRTSGDSLLTIINDILDFSKIEAGRMELESQPFDLRVCVESAVDLLAGKAREKGLDLACVVESDVLVGILGDVTRLRQVLVNLVGNAIKFTEQGEVVVSVSYAPAPPDNGKHDRPKLKFSVRDTGLGIPPERQNRLFQSFSQVDASTTRRFGGTGLGLAISRRLVELMGGSLWVESEGIPGKGSTFNFTICAAEAEVPSPRPYLCSAQPQLEGKRVLIVDDNATNRNILTRQVKAWGMLPQDTASPKEALAWVQQGAPFEVALLDLQMPEMDGMTLAAEVRHLRDASQLPIVMLSSLGPREAGSESIALAAYLLKPVKSSQLYNTLVRIFGSAEAAPVVSERASSSLDNEMGRRHPLSILLAEDNANNQKLALLVLQRLGYRADVAANGLEVLQSLRRQPYDLVLMDVQMPEMDGLEATRALQREFPGGQRPRIVAMTANAMKEDRDECFAAGMDDFLTKPIQFDDLVAALNRCQRRAGSAEGQSPAQSLGKKLAGPQGSTRAAALPQAPAESTPPAAPPLVFDPVALQRLKGNLGRQADVLLPGLINGFIEEAPKLMAEAARSLVESRNADLRRAAHTLKSNSATFGAMALSTLARELEYAARDGALEGAGGLLARLQAEFDQARLALQAWPSGTQKE